MLPEKQCYFYSYEIKKPNSSQSRNELLPVKWKVNEIKLRFLDLCELLSSCKSFFMILGYYLILLPRFFSPTGCHYAVTIGVLQANSDTGQ